jgi:multicomponent Na+:H+ antiporter subunit G
MISQILAIIIVIIATTFSVIGVLGFHRLPDVYTRLHATGKVGVLGVVLLLIAAAVSTPLAWSKALVLILFLLVAGPVTAHTLGSAAYRLDIKMKNPSRNDLEELKEYSSTG